MKYQELCSWVSTLPPLIIKEIEVNRPNRSPRRRIGKSDTTDAEMTAEAVISGVARDEPKSGVDKVEMIRMLKSTKDSVMKGRTQTINKIKALVVTAPVKLRAALSGLTHRRHIVSPGLNGELNHFQVFSARSPSSERFLPFRLPYFLPMPIPLFCANINS